jgi:LysR family transcriptional regulator, transcriptional activator of nhaA
VKRSFSYRHLYYFWAVGHEGGVAKAAARLGMAVQTVSAQVNELERSLGHALLKPAGRGLALTEAGRVAMRQADAIFQLGEALPALVRDAAGVRQLRLAVGVSDGLAKLVVRHVMQPVLAMRNARLLFHDDEFDDLVGDLALHRLDVVLADRPAPANPNVRVYSHVLGTWPVAWYAAPALRARARQGFPASLARVPVILPTTHVAMRARLDAWFERHGVRPLVAGEFEDSALMKTFGARGMGVFPAAEVVEHELAARYGVRRIGVCDGVSDACYAIGTERKIAHPLVQRLVGGR